MILPYDQWQPRVEGCYDIPADTYHAAPGLSHSMLRHIEPTPAHLVHYLSEKREVTPEMMLGTLVHARILEPHKPLPRIAIKPEKYPAPADCSAVKSKKAQPGDLLDWHGSSTYCKQWIKEQSNAGNIVLSEAEAETLNRMVDGVAKHPRVIDILDGAQTEVSIFRQQGSLFRKHRIDIVTRYNFLADVKSTDDASPEAFAKNLVAKDWAAQADDYLSAWNQMNPDDPRVGFVFIVVERETGLCALYYLTERALDFGRSVNKRRLAIASECYATNSFPGFPEEIQAGDIEDWAARKVGL